jgi:hypothetical protein
MGEHPGAVQPQKLSQTLQQCPVTQHVQGQHWGLQHLVMWLRLASCSLVLYRWQRTNPVPPSLMWGQYLAKSCYCSFVCGVIVAAGGFEPPAVWSCKPAMCCLIC